MKNLSVRLASLAFIFLGLPQVGDGQEVAVQVDESVVVDAPIVVSGATYTVSPPMLATPMPIPSYGWYGGGDSGMHLLHDPSVMKDLELVDDQKERLNQVRKDYGKQLRDVMKQFSKAKNDQERIKELQEEMQLIQKEQSEAMSNVLLPHQLDRIKQVSNQMQMNSMGTAGALQYGNLAKELEITDDQKKKLAKIQQDLQKQIAEATKRLQESAKKKVMQELTADQRSKLDDMVGEEFKRDPNDWRERYKPKKKSKKLERRGD